MDSIEKRARELYAAALRANGMDFTAERVLDMMPAQGVAGSVRATIDAIIASLTEQWRPIASAPKDGTEIIGFSPAVGNPLLIRWIAPHEFMTTEECERYMDGVEEADADDAEAWLEKPDWAYADFRSGDFLADDCQPTHWQPLPAPPEVEG